MIIFDMDGVIFDTEALYLTCWAPIAEAERMENTEQVAHLCVGVTRQRTLEILQAHYPHVADMAAVMKRVEAEFHRRATTEGLPLKYHARELLEFLTAKGETIALATSTLTDIATRELKDANLLHHFHAIVGGDQVTRSKPAPDIFLLACEKLGCQPDEAYVIEDSVYGIQAAMAAGTKPIMVPDLVPPTKEIRASAIPILENLEAVQHFLEKCCP